jgi:hypothetical protein
MLRRGTEGWLPSVFGGIAKCVLGVIDKSHEFRLVSHENFLYIRALMLAYICIYLESGS